MLVLDMIILAILMLLMEKRILSNKYILLSPYALAHFAFLYIYIVPFAFYGNYSIDNYVNRLDERDVFNFLLYLRLFYYSFCFVSIYTLFKVKQKIKRNLPFNKKLSSTFIIVAVPLLVLISVGSELIITGFNINLLVDKMINPREYTYLREGLGMFTHALQFSKLMLLYISALYFAQNKNNVSLIILLFSIIMNFMGGSKSTLLIIVILLVLVFQKSTFKFNNVKISKLFFYGIVLSLLLVFSFFIMRTTDDRSTFTGAVEGIVNYSQEAYHSTNVVRDFQWKPEYPKAVAEGLIYTPIPRIIFPNKDYYGLYNDYWRPTYQSNTVQYHTSTYGFLAEGHMLFSYLSPFVYAVLFNVIFGYIYISFYKSKSYSTMFFIIYILTNLYFLVRTGLFMTTGLWLYIFYYIASIIFFLIMNKFNHNYYYLTKYKSR